MPLPPLVFSPACIASKHKSHTYCALCIVTHIPRDPADLDIQHTMLTSSPAQPTKSRPHVPPTPPISPHVPTWLHRCMQFYGHTLAIKPS